MNIDGKLRLNTYLMVGLFVVYLVTIAVHMFTVKNGLTHLAQLEVTHESLLEIEINISEHAMAVKMYVLFPGESTRSRIKDAQNDLDRFLLKFSSVSELDSSISSISSIGKIIAEQKVLGNDLVSTSEQRRAALKQLSKLSAIIDELMDAGLQVGISVSDTHHVTKLEAALDMEVNIHEAISAIQHYALMSDSGYLEQIYDAKDDFKRFLNSYSATDHTSAEDKMLRRIETEFAAAMETGNRVVELTKKLNEYLARFSDNNQEMDHILDDKIQTYIHQRVVDQTVKLKRAETSSIYLILLAFVVLILVARVSARVSGGIVQGIGRLTHGLKQFENGNLDYLITDINSDKTEDELVVLAHDFNTMAGSLKETTTSRDTLLQEIETRKNVEKELESSRERFAGILEIAKEAIISIGEDQKIIIFNKGAEETFGYTEEEVLGRPLDILIPQTVHEIHRLHVKEFSRSDDITRTMGGKKDMDGLHKNGKLFPIEGTITKIFSNGVLILTVILRDISERKRHEQQLQDHNTLLEKAVDQKTGEMEELSDRLVRQEKLATIGKISGNIAHELRNPLGTINQSVFFISRVIKRGQVDEYLDKIERSLTLIETELRTAEKVITNLLDATRRKELKLRSTDLQQMMLDTVSSNQLINKIDISFQLDPVPFLVMVDQDQFRQVISNLLSNTIQTEMEESCVTVSGRILRVEGLIEIEIEDDGPGISTDILEHVFEPLFTTKDLGVGLGLHICQQVIEAHHGTINISSPPGHGTKVKIQLPLRAMESEVNVDRSR